MSGTRAAATNEHYEQGSAAAWQLAPLGLLLEADGPCRFSHPLSPLSFGRRCRLIGSKKAPDRHDSLVLLAALDQSSHSTARNLLSGSALAGEIRSVNMAKKKSGGILKYVCRALLGEPLKPSPLVEVAMTLH